MERVFLMKYCTAITVVNVVAVAQIGRAGHHRLLSPETRIDPVVVKRDNVVDAHPIGDVPLKLRLHRTHTKDIVSDSRHLPNLRLTGSHCTKALEPIRCEA